jgi:nucleolar pre-ribosomal-associated protein 1
LHLRVFVCLHNIDLQNFGKFLSEKAAPQLKAGKSSHEIQILLEYLKSVTPNEDHESVNGLPDILQAWRFAVQTNDEGLSSAIPGAIASLLQVIDASIEFSEVGSRICKLLLKKDNVQLFEKSLNSPKAKFSSISACLKLLTHIVGFNGGICARDLYIQRDTTLRRLDVFLGFQGSKPSNKTSVRDLAISYLLANLRFQGQEAKSELLSQPKILRMLLQEISAEKPNNVQNVLNTLRTYVLQDNDLPKSLKGRLLTDKNLVQILNICQTKASVHSNAAWPDIVESAYQFLELACTSQKHGIVFKEHGWYPPGTEEQVIKEDEKTGHISSNKKNQFEKFKDRVPVRNTTLASFIQELKPWASIRERDLILAIFKAAPELVADYFFRRKMFLFDPKLSSTWVGWATFIFSVIQLPIPAHDMYIKGFIRCPPPTSVILQCIMPQPLTAKALKKCLTQNSNLIRLFASRILISASRKLRQVLLLFRSKDSPNAWRDVADKIQSEIELRYPEFRVLVTAYQSCSDSQYHLRECLSSLIGIYYTLLPRLALTTTFDPSSHIVDRLTKITTQSADGFSKLIALDMEHLLEIASHNYEGRWWQKSGMIYLVDLSKLITLGDSPLSFLTSILRLIASGHVKEVQTLKQIVANILQEYHILCPIENIRSLDALLQSLTPKEGLEIEDETYNFLDDCLLRVARSSIKYEGYIDELSQDSTSRHAVSAFFTALVEQWPFFIKTHSKSEIIACAVWINRYMNLAKTAGESDTVLQALNSQIMSSSQDDDLKLVFDRSLDEELLKNAVSQNSDHSEKLQADEASLNIEKSFENREKVYDSLLAPIPEKTSHPALTRWTKKDIMDAIIDLDIADLIHCLRSGYTEIRLQAVQQLQHFMSSLQVSVYLSACYRN